MLRLMIVGIVLSACNFGKCANLTPYQETSNREIKDNEDTILGTVSEQMNAYSTIILTYEEEFEFKISFERTMASSEIYYCEEVFRERDPKYSICSYYNEIYTKCTDSLVMPVVINFSYGEEGFSEEGLFKYQDWGDDDDGEGWSLESDSIGISSSLGRGWRGNYHGENGVIYFLTE